MSRYEAKTLVPHIAATEGEHGVQMHSGAGLGDLAGNHPIRSAVCKQGFGQLTDGLRG